MRSIPPSSRVCIVMMSAIGDSVHVLPVVKSLKRHDPTVHITWILQPAAASLMQGHPDVDEILVFRRRAGIRGFLEIREQLRRRRFDLVLNLQVYLKAGLVTLMTRAPIKLGFDRRRARDLNWLVTNRKIPPHEPQHVQDQYFEFLRYLGVPAVLEWGLRPTDEERARYAPLLSAADVPTVALVVGTSNPEKEWAPERYAALADRMHDETGARSILVGGRSDRENAAAESILAAAAHPPLDLREWDLRRLVCLVDRADLLVTPDTGPLHIGVALGTPTVGVFGHTNPKRYGPYRRFSELVVDGFGDPGEAYDAAAGRRRGRMARVSVEEVLAKVKLGLERYPRAAERGQAAP